ncbi:MAG: ribonuclease HII [Actinobacteria bacterium]|nr:ribonuclease HII [Actinomycetota bacterium]
MMDITTSGAHDIAVRLRTASYDELPQVIERYRNDPRRSVKAAVCSAMKRLEANDHEIIRTRALYTAQIEFGGTGMVVGIDEVGRGAVAGPLTVAAVVLPLEPLIIGLNDSKQLTPTRREELAREIKACALAIGIAHIAPEDIDACGMAASLRVAMLRALESTNVEPDSVLIDGNPMHLHKREISIVKGDGKIAAIAAASIVAKVTRDAIMVRADKDYPGYGFASAKGYASAEHIDAIKTLGLTDFHRASFCRGFLSEQLTFLDM